MRLKKRTADFFLIVIIMLLIIIGIIMVFSSSAVTCQEKYNDAYHYLKKQVMWAGLGLAAMFFIMQLDYRKLKKLVLPIFYLCIFLLILVLIIGKDVKGSTRWIGLGSLAFQPTETIKLALVLFLSKFLSEKKQKIESFKYGIMPILILLGFISGLILLQPDLGTTIAIAGTTFIMMFAAGARYSHLTFLGVMGLSLVGLAIKIKPYRMKRFTAFLNPWEDPLDTGFQTVQSLLALGSGGLFGVGLGESRQKLSYLPEQHTDFIYAILGEELGFIGGALIILLFILFIWRGYKIAIDAPDSFSSFLAVGITSMIGLQAIINLGVVTGSLPVTGITLPFISYGGSSLVFTMVSVGLLLNISRYCSHK